MIIKPVSCRGQPAGHAASRAEHCRRKPQQAAKNPSKGSGVTLRRQCTAALALYASSITPRQQVMTGWSHKMRVLSLLQRVWEDAHAKEQSTQHTCFDEAYIWLLVNVDAMTIWRICDNGIKGRPSELCAVNICLSQIHCPAEIAAVMPAVMPGVSRSIKTLLVIHL